MEKLVKELKDTFNFKDNTDVGDVVVIAAKEPQMLVYAYITGINRDTTRKDEWWHVDLSILTMPPQKMTWTLRTAQMTGMEIFTMGGEERFVKALEFGAHLPIKNPSPPSKTEGLIKRIK
ncbi:MAG TPA: hypothetical protein VJ969_02940 [Desulfopila sp.]|nr:hypothetical protein [Desulfopila sp.]